MLISKHFKSLLAIVALICLTTKVFAQQPVSITSQINEHLFVRNEVAYLEDANGTLSLKQVMSPAYAQRFKENSTGTYAKNYNRQSYYWYRVNVVLQDLPAGKQSLIEFFDQTTGDITAYLPDTVGKYTSLRAGATLPFGQRLLKHKNFEFEILNRSNGKHTYYFRVKSHEQVNVIIVYRSIKYFVYYALTEYLTFGIFYGMILIFALHNLLMFIAVKRVQYLIYVLYILSVGFYEMCVDGIAFQYLWPTWPGWNEHAYGTFLFLISIFALEFAKAQLQLKVRAPRFYKVVNLVIILRTAYFFFCLLFYRNLFIYKFIDVIPLLIAFAAGLHIWIKGFKPARFFVVGYACLSLSFMLKAATVLGINHLVGRVLGHYSLSIGFMLEMIFLSFSIGDQVRLLRKEKDAAQDDIMHQLHVNAELKDSLNRELEEQVKIRTAEVVRQSDEISKQAAIIERQNQELTVKNDTLEKQSHEISRMNLLLEDDNLKLKTNIEKVTDARVLSAELSFEEFSAKYPNQEACYKFLSELKWATGYQCTRCNNTVYCAGRTAYSRRCTKCAYEESVLQRTLFHNNRIPINKAFYLVYLMYTSKGTISSHKLSEKLDIRQSTCWSYSNKIKQVMLERKKKRGSKNTSNGWSSIVIGSPLDASE